MGPTDYAVTPRDGNTNSPARASAAASEGAREGYDGHVTFYVEVPDVEAALEKAESKGAPG